MNSLTLLLILAASEIHVSPAGSDAGLGTLASPYQTLTRALLAAVDGDTITLRGGTYPGNITVSRNVLIRSTPGERAKILASFAGTNLVLSHSTNAVLRDLDFEGGSSYGVDFDSCTDSIMEGCKVWGVDGDLVKVSPGSLRVTIRGCEIFGNLAPTAAEGIDAVKADYLTVQDTYIHDTQSDGAYAKGGCRFTVFERCLFERCGLNPNTYGAAVLLGQHTGGVPFVYENEDSVVRNCVMLDINGAGMGAVNALRPKFLNNTLYNVAKLDRAGIVLIPASTGPCVDATLVNNIVVIDPSSTRHSVWIYNGGLTGTLTMDRNRYFRGSGMFQDSRPGGGLYTLAGWKVALGTDLLSTIGDPGVDAGGHLLAGSFCIDQGQTQAGFLDDYDGEARGASWDIGADEYGAGGAPPPVPPPPPTPGPAPAPPPSGPGAPPGGGGEGSNGDQSLNDSCSGSMAFWSGLSPAALLLVSSGALLCLRRRRIA